MNVEDMFSHFEVSCNLYVTKSSSNVLQNRPICVIFSLVSKVTINPHQKIKLKKIIYEKKLFFAVQFNYYGNTFKLFICQQKIL